MPRGESPNDLIEETRRQEAVVIAITATDFPKIIAWPIEFVAFCNNDPRTLVIESKMTLYRRRKFDCTRMIGRSGVRDWQNHDNRCVIRWAIACASVILDQA